MSEARGLPSPPPPPPSLNAHHHHQTRQSAEEDERASNNVAARSGETDKKSETIVNMGKEPAGPKTARGAATTAPAVSPALDRTLQLIIFIIGFVDVFSSGMMVPLIPTILKSFGRGVATIGLMGSLQGVAKFVSAPVFGWIMDRFGFKAALMTTLVGAAVAYIPLLFATSVEMVVLAKILLGAFRQTVFVCEAMISATTEHDKRASLLGRLHGSSSAGFVFGPLLGGYLATRIGSPKAVSIFPLIMFSMTAAYMLFRLEIPHRLLPGQQNGSNEPFPGDSDLSTTSESRSEGPRYREKRGLIGNTEFTESEQHNSRNKPLPREQVKELQTTKKASLLMQWQETWDAIASSSADILESGILDFVFIQLMVVLPLMMARSIFPAFAYENYGLSTMMVSYTLSAQGLLGAVFSYFLGKMLKVMQKGSNMIAPALALELISYGLLFEMPNLALFLLVTVPLRFTGSVLRACLASAVASCVSASHCGVVLGVTQSVLAVGRMLAPSLAGFLLSVSSLHLTLGCALFSAAGLAVAVLRPFTFKQKERKAA